MKPLVDRGNRRRSHANAEPGRSRNQRRAQMGRLRPGHVLVLIVGLFLAGCTGAQPADPAKSAAAGADSSDAASSGRSDATESAAGEVGPTRNIPALPPPEPAVDARGDANEGLAELLAAMPGMYGLARLQATLLDDRIEIAAATDCSTALEMLQSGQWAVDIVAEPDDAALTEHGSGAPALYLAALRLGNQASLARLEESGGTCTGSVARPFQAQFVLSGIVGGDAPADYVSLLCEAGLDATRAQLSGLYATAVGTYLVTATIPLEAGTADLPELHDLEVLQAPAGEPAINWAVRHLADALLGSGVPGPDPPGPSLLRYPPDGSPNSPAALRLTPTPEAVGTATIIETAPLTGSIDLVGLTPKAGVQEAVSMTAGFGCQL